MAFIDVIYGPSSGGIYYAYVPADDGHRVCIADGVGRSRAEGAAEHVLRYTAEGCWPRLLSRPWRSRRQTSATTAAHT